MSMSFPLYLRRILPIILFSLIISESVLAVMPANVVVVISQDENQRDQVLNQLYVETWKMLEGEFDVRFTAPKIDRINNLYADDGVDAVIVVGESGKKFINKFHSISKPTIILNQQGSSHVEHRPVTHYIDDVALFTGESKQTYIQRIVSSLRDRLRHL
jgi:hypothetical protein